jgi:integrase
VTGKPARPHWRKQGEITTTVRATAGEPYAASVRAHSETVLRSFYDFHRDAGTGPILNPFPLDRSRRSRRAHAHHNPMDDWNHERVGRYRPTLPRRIPRAIPDDRFNELFAALSSNRDRALVAFWISTGARASELLGVRQRDVDPGQQLITVVRKGTRAIQQVPASADAFVWLRLYQEELHGKVPRGRTQPVWWTLRRPIGR